MTEKQKYYIKLMQEKKQHIQSIIDEQESKHPTDNIISYSIYRIRAIEDTLEELSNNNLKIVEIKLDTKEAQKVITDFITAKPMQQSPDVHFDELLKTNHNQAAPAPDLTPVKQIEEKLRELCFKQEAIIRDIKVQTERYERFIHESEIQAEAYRTVLHILKH